MASERGGMATSASDTPCSRISPMDAVSAMPYCTQHSLTEAPRIFMRAFEVELVPGLQEQLGRWMETLHPCAVRPPNQEDLQVVLAIQVGLPQRLARARGLVRHADPVQLRGKGRTSRPARPAPVPDGGARRQPAKEASAVPRMPCTQCMRA